MCGVNRLSGESGACGAPATLRLARAALHFYEEPPISGEGGSGTVFFSGCSLGCIYCQNHQISRGGVGFPVGRERLTEIFFELCEKGAENINLVTPTHYAPTVALAIEDAKAQGFSLPFVYNSGGYERVETLRRLEGLIDVYLPDYKYADSALSALHIGAPDYPAVADAALLEMLRQAPKPEYDARGMLRRGVLVRHLMLPGAYRNSHDVVKHLSRYREAILLSLMNQYTPMPLSQDLAARFPSLLSPVPEKEYRRLLAYASRLGLQGFSQEGGTVSESFIPAFDGTGIKKTD